MPTVPYHVAALSQEFPGWTLWLSGTGRWWASWRDELSAAELAAGCVPFLHADSPGALAAQLLAQEALRPGLPVTGQTGTTPRGRA
jgi:hypothetical protein